MWIQAQLSMGKDHSICLEDIYIIAVNNTLLLSFLCYIFIWN